jgi:hypothetical protein
VNISQLKLRSEKFDDDDDDNNNNNDGDDSNNNNKQIANTDSVNNLIRQCNTSHHHAQYWQKNSTLKRRDSVCAELHFNICKEIGVKLDIEH